MFDDKSILITGGTGSFGKAAVRMILDKFKPKRLVVFSRDELKQYEMAEKFPDSKYPCIRYFIGDVREESRLNQAFHNIDYVIHAAALKQVPAAEYNPMECIKTNVLGAQNVINAAIQNGVEKVVALSTDKAANPVNLYGATKLASDKLFVAANNLAGSRKTRFSVVRYGNVIGSRGSIIPVFKRFIESNRETLPITHKDMTRFLITIEQGVEFVLKAFQRMYGGEVFVPKLASIKISHIAKAMAPDKEIEYIGLRPGEKIHEVMCPQDDSHLTLEFEDHFVIRPSITFTVARDFAVNNIQERGVPVPENFSYSSDTNSVWLSGEDLLDLAERTMCLN